MRRRLGIQVTEAIPTIGFRYALQDFNFLNNHLIQTSEGNLSTFVLRYFDGQERGEVYDIAPDTVEVGTRHGEEISVNVQGIAENMSNGLPAITWQDDITIPPSTWRETVDINISKEGFFLNLSAHFRSWSMRANHNAFADVTGNVITPVECFWGKADYSGRIEVAKSMASLGGKVNTSHGKIQYIFKNRAASPVTTTYTFEPAVITQAEVRLPMDLVVQRIEWYSNHCEIA